VTGSASNEETLPMHDGGWRRPSLLAVVRLTAVVGTVWLGAIFAGSPALIRSLPGITDMVLLVATWVACFVPLPEIVFFAVIEATFLASSVASILVFGLSPGVPVGLGLFVLVAAIYFDWKGGISAGIATLLVIGAGAWGWMTGRLPIGPGVPPLSLSSYDIWMRTGFAQVLAISSITGIVAFIHREMRSIATRLSRTEEKFKRAFHICPDAMMITELDTGRIIEVNESHERLTGYARDEVIGRTSVDIGSFRNLEEREEFVKAIVTKGSARLVESQIRNKDGRTVDVVYSSECFQLEGKKCIVSIIQDITERKRTEAALVANEERLRSFIDNASVGIYRSTPEGRIIMANPTMLRLTGYDTFEELEARNLETESYEPSYSRKEFRDRLERAGTLIGLEAKWKRRDGSTIFVRETSNVIRGADGSVLYYDGVIEDVSERKRAEDALRESEERFRNLTSAAFESIVISEDGKIIDINDQGLKMFGFERAEMIGRKIIEFVSPEWRDRVAENIRTRRETLYEHELLRKDGTKFHAEAQAKMTRLGDRVLRMTAVRDVTERIQTEQRQQYLEEQLRQSQKLEALGTLAGGIAHDFNNILTGIMANLELAEIDLPSGHPAASALRNADKASRRARDLIVRILAFSRLEQDKLASAALGPVVLEAVQLLRAGVPSEIEIRTDIDGNCPPVSFDSGQIHQIIMNLGTNSMHAMRENGVLQVKLHPVSPSLALRERHPQVRADHAVCLSIRDNGCGMEPAVLKRIFEPFYTTKKFGQGTGLGLAMVHSIMTAQNGAIVVESAPGTGTTFDLYFPAAVTPAPDPAPGAPSSLREVLAPFGNGRCIMLVDDDEAVRTIGTAIIKRLGFNPDTHSHPALALEAFRASPSKFCAVVSDYTMPEMNGIELTAHIMKIRPDTPIILASGFLQTETKNDAREAGVSSIVHKPFELQELVEQIRAVLNENI
jgi:PAS domain S-box-containing protein